MDDNHTTEEATRLAEAKALKSREPKLSELRRKLWYKAKQEPDFRFYALYDRVYREDTFREAYRQVRANGGGPGVDGMTFELLEAEENGAQNLLEELRKELITKTYQPKPVKRVYIPKANGAKRPLGIPCIRDRVVQKAVLLIIEPIFEADFKDCSFGFRPNRRAADALERIVKALEDYQWQVYDADLSQYFDTVGHEKLLELIEKRIADRSILSLIRKWLTCPVEEDGNRTKPTRGTPQGGVISPLLANIYLNEFDKGFHEEESNPFQRTKATLVRYADDFVVLSRTVNKQIKGWIEEVIEGRLGLKVNQDKTKWINFNRRKASLDFLGFTIRHDKCLHGRAKKYWNTFPSKKSAGRYREKIRNKTGSGRKDSLMEVIEDINTFSRGWKGYFSSVGYPTKVLRSLDHYVLTRFRRFLRNRSQRICKALRKGETLYKGLQRMGLQRMGARC